MTTEDTDQTDCSGAVPEADFFVSPEGDDTWSGTSSTPASDGTDGPFATLIRARDAVRALRAQGDAEPDRDLFVLVRGGTYPLRETIVFGLRDSSPEGTTTTYAAYPGERPVFTSEVPVTGWRRVSDPPDGISQEAADHLWVADLPAHSPHRVYTLYDGEQRLPRARSGGFLPLDPPEGAPPSRTRLYFPPGALKAWEALDDIEILVRPAHAWITNILQLASVDEDAGVATVTVPATYALVRPRHFIDTIREAVWVENTFEGLTEPGNWVLRSADRKVYLWPRGETPGDTITVPCLRELVRVEGEIDLDGPTDTPVRGLIFRGLTFTHGDRDVMTDHDTGLQHDWELFDKGNALFRLRGTEDCTVEACRLAHTGGGAIRLDLHSRHNRVIGNLIEHVGATGILLNGYGAGTKDVNGSNTISNNHIHHIGELLWHAIGIFVWQSGSNKITHNLIHHTGYDAIVLSGIRPNLFRWAWHPGARPGAEPDKLYPGEAPPNTREAGTIRRSEAGSVDAWRTWLATLGLPSPAAFTAFLERARPFYHVYDNLVQDNQIHHAVSILGDGNAIYLSDVDRGNVIRRNYVHDLVGKGGVSGIRTDAYMTDCLVEQNIAYRCNCGGLNMKYYDNHAINNVVVDIPPIQDVDIEGNPITLSFGHISVMGVFPRDEMPPGSSARVERNIIYKTDATQPFYREARRGGDRAELGVENCAADANLYYAPAEPDLGQGHLARYQALGLDTNSVIADPGFIDLVGGDFRLRADSPALALGIESIDTSGIGLIASLPHFEDLGG